LLKEKEEQLETAKNFFKREEQRQWVETNQNIAEFRHISRNAVATAKIGGRSKQKILIVLKRYQASTADQTIQGDWIVETVLQ
jgi:ribosomal protein L25 (general stress protein Ctc)